VQLAGRQSPTALMLQRAISMITYLYKKTHNITGLQYLGKTSKSDPYTYQGSGKYWKSHINTHGYNVTTQILKECSSDDEVKFWGEYYSKLWNVVADESWANLKIESGDGGTPPQEIRQQISAKLTGRKLSETTRSKMAAAKLGKKRGPHSVEHRAKIGEAQKGRDYKRDANGRFFSPIL